MADRDQNPIMDIVANMLYPNQGKGKDYGFGTRQDGSYKGPGFLGVLKRPDGFDMTEYSIGVQIDGKETDIPTLVPTLTDDEINTMLNIRDDEKIPDAIIEKAVKHAKKRIKEGKSPFYGADDEIE